MGWGRCVFRHERLQGPSPCLQSLASGLCPGPRITQDHAKSSLIMERCQWHRPHSSKAMEGKELSLQASSTKFCILCADSCNHSCGGELSGLTGHLWNWSPASPGPQGPAYETGSPQSTILCYHYQKRQWILSDDKPPTSTTHLETA